MSFLSIPVEIRLKIYYLLLAHRTVLVETDSPTDPGADEDDAVWHMKMKRVGSLHPQILRTCKQVAAEGGDLLYADNVFDCSQREGIHTLYACLEAERFSRIRHLVLDWEQLEDLAWSLAKPEGRTLYANLESVVMATWRTRVLGGSSYIWRQNKSYEWKLCQYASDILEKHDKLGVVLQKRYSTAKAMAGPRSMNTSRVKWRFATSESLRLDGEVVVDLKADMDSIKVNGGESDRTVEQRMDPF